MKRVREFRTAGDFFYCDVTFLSGPSEDDLWDDLVDVPAIVHGSHLRMSFLIRYPKNVRRAIAKTRFACISHPNLSPVLVAEEASRFLSLIKQMLEL